MLVVRGALKLSNFYSSGSAPLIYVKKLWLKRIIYTWEYLIYHVLFYKFFWFLKKDMIIDLDKKREILI